MVKKDIQSLWIFIFRFNDQYFAKCFCISNCLSGGVFFLFQKLSLHLWEEFPDDNGNFDVDVEVNHDESDTLVKGLNPKTNTYF